MPLRLALLVVCATLVIDGVVAQDASLVKAAEYTCISPSGRFRMEQFHTTTGDIWDWQFWFSRKGGGPAVRLETGDRDPAMYGASFSFHPSEKWLLRTQKTGSGDNVAVLYRITKEKTLVKADGEKTFDDVAWAEFDRLYSLTGESTQRYHTWCEFLGWEPDGETLRLRLTAAHCGEEYHADWTVHYHLVARKFFFASDDRAHNKKLGLVWKKRGKLALTAHGDLRLFCAGHVISVPFPLAGREKHTLIVAKDGFVEVPYIGKVRAAGRTCKQLAVLIKVEIEKQYFG